MKEGRLSIHKDNSKLDNYKAIVDIVSYVEWAAVHKCMELLNWEWTSCNGVPEVGQLMQEATSIATEYVKKSIDNKQSYMANCGGIQIRTQYFEEGDVALTIQFVLSEWDNYL